MSFNIFNDMPNIKIFIHLNLTRLYYFVYSFNVIAIHAATEAALEAVTDAKDVEDVEADFFEWGEFVQGFAGVGIVGSSSRIGRGCLCTTTSCLIYNGNLVDTINGLDPHLIH